VVHAAPARRATSRRDGFMRGRITRIMIRSRHAEPQSDAPLQQPRDRSSGGCRLRHLLLDHHLVGVGKGLSWRPGSWVKSFGKLVENGHATTFLIDRRTRKNIRITMTGMGDDGWIFDEGGLDEIDWARTTANADTFVYYIGGDREFLKKYAAVQKKLEKTRASYAVLWPNLIFAKTQYDNCVSHSHYLMSQLGIAYWTNRKGWWVPSISNWVDWFKSFVPVRAGAFWWKYKVFRGVNTHIPAPVTATDSTPKSTSSRTIATARKTATLRTSTTAIGARTSASVRSAATTTARTSASVRSSNTSRSRRRS
jgi:hypothetical protein